MKLIYSFSVKQNFESPSKKLDILYFYFLSNLFAKQSGFETVMFCEKNDEDYLQGIDYDKIEYISSSEILEYPAWAGNSLHKILAISKTKEPFIYCNPTSVLFKDIFLKENLGKDIFYISQAVSKDVFVNKAQKIIKKYPEIPDISYRNRYYNTAIFGGNDYLTINKSANIVLDFLNKERDYLDFICGDNFLNMENNNALYSANLPSMIDSVWLPQLCEFILEKPMIQLFSNAETEQLEKKSFDKELADGTFEIENFSSILYKYAERHNDLILRLKSESGFYDTNSLTSKEINKINGYAMMKYGLSF